MKKALTSNSPKSSAISEILICFALNSAAPNPDGPDQQLAKVGAFLLQLALHTVLRSLHLGCQLL
ncbi:hypothetical protein UMZ34_13255 [Halopseudomonas pachastrellae]|nr:hypothetical protein UMZ34_13255 [Halopseudomonas pachastrellae]